MNLIFILMNADSVDLGENKCYNCYNVTKKELPYERFE